MKQLFFCLCFLNILGSKLSAQNNSFGTVGIIVNHESHRFNVDFGPPSTRGNHNDRNITFGVVGKYNKELLTNVNGYVGLGVMQRISKINRIYNREFWDDYTAILNYTKNTIYNLLHIPVGIDYKIINSKKLDVLIGTAFNTNFSYMQKYGEPDEETDHIFRFYYFGYSNNISITFLHHLPNNKLIEIRPFLTTYETWRKDEILFENQKQYHNMKFKSFGINLSYGMNM